MSEIGEQVAVDAVAKGNEDCWYCKQAAPKECVNEEDENPPSDDTDPDSVQENDVRNDSSALGSKISPRPVWDIPLPGQA